MKIITNLNSEITTVNILDVFPPSRPCPFLNMLFPSSSPSSLPLFPSFLLSLPPVYLFVSLSSPAIPILIRRSERTPTGEDPQVSPICLQPQLHVKQSASCRATPSGGKVTPDPPGWAEFGKYVCREEQLELRVQQVSRDRISRELTTITMPTDPSASLHMVLQPLFSFPC